MDDLVFPAVGDLYDCHPVRLEHTSNLSQCFDVAIAGNVLDDTDRVNQVERILGVLQIARVSELAAIRRKPQGLSSPLPAVEDRRIIEIGGQYLPLGVARQHYAEHLGAADVQDRGISELIEFCLGDGEWKAAPISDGSDQGFRPGLPLAAEQQLAANAQRFGPKAELTHSFHQGCDPDIDLHGARASSAAIVAWGVDGCNRLLDRNEIYFSAT